MKRRVLLTVAALAAACGPKAKTSATSTPPPALGTGAPTAAPAAEPAEPVLNLDVTLDAEKAQLLVRLDLPLAWILRPLKEVAITFTDLELEDGGGNGYGRFVSVVRDDGTSAPWPRTFRDPGATLTVRYRVALKHHEAKPKHGVDDVPRPTGRGWALVGRAFAPLSITIDGGKRVEMPTHVAFHLPGGWTMASTHGDGVTSFDLDVPWKAAHALYVAGDLAHIEVEHDEAHARVRIVSGDFVAGELAPFTRLVKRVLTVASGALGPAVGRDLLIVVDRDPEGFNGSVIGGGVTVLTAVAPIDRAMAPTGIVATHELMHLWNQTKDSERWRWLHEGFTRFWEIVMMLRADGASPEVAIDALLDTYRSYVSRSFGRTLRDAKDVMAYDGGATIAFCADAELRAAGTSLADVHRSVGEGAFPYDPETLLAKLNEASPGLGPRIAAWLGADTPVDIRPCLEIAKWKPREVGYSGVSDEALRRRVLGVERVTSFGLRVLEPLAGSALRAGDVVIGMAGAPVTRLANADWALRAKKAGAVIALDVLRDGATIRVDLTLPKLPAADRPARKVLSVARAIPDGPNLLLE